MIPVIESPWSPVNIAQLNDQVVRVAYFKGSITCINMMNRISYSMSSMEEFGLIWKSV
ncbi:hypothetical protein GF326_02960 [Candidatus Bathyarchaeota archaeon]|nr:hypothetical protein [Candidatus Bathyarchaeota archaeon]